MCRLFVYILLLPPLDSLLLLLRSRREESQGTRLNPRHRFFHRPIYFFVRGWDGLSYGSSRRMVFKSRAPRVGRGQVGGKSCIKNSANKFFFRRLRITKSQDPSKLGFTVVFERLHFSLGSGDGEGTEDIYKLGQKNCDDDQRCQVNTNTVKPLATTIATSKSRPSKSNIPDCCICLFGVTIRQALFIAPCSHTFHYKCIKPILDVHQPSFCCPLCRTFADLDEDVEVEIDPAFEDDDSAVEDGPGPSTVNSPAVGGESVSRPGTAELRDANGLETEVEEGRVGISRNNRLSRLSDLHEPEEAGLEDARDAEMVDDVLRTANPFDGTSSGSLPIRADEDGDVVLVDAGLTDVNGGITLRGHDVVRSDVESDGQGSPAVADEVGVMLADSPMQEDGGSSDSNSGSKRKR